jgi:hypothetical protein
VGVGPAREALELDGYRVLGTAPTGIATVGLGDEGFADVRTVDRLLFDLGNGKLELDGRAVLVVDDAAMLGTRKLGPLLDHAHHARAKVILVGDDRQFAPIDAGGGFRALRLRLGASELTVNRRQVEAWEQRAIDDVRDGRIEAAIAAYAEHDRIRAFEGRDDRDRALVSDWWQSHQAGEEPVVYAHRRAQVDRLNTVCQRLRAHHGQLGAERLAVGDRTFAVGDRVVLGANALGRLGVANGTSAEITALNVPGRTMTIRILEEEPPRTVTLPGWYLDAVVRPGQSRRVDLAYAHTDMRSQGRTEQRALLALDGKEDMQGSYVQLTRGKERTDMYLTMGPGPLGDHDGHPRGEPVEPARLLGRVLTRDGSKTLATDTPVLAEVRRWSTSRLREERDQLAALGRECRPDRSRELAWRHRVDAHAQEPARRLGTGWDRLEPTLPPAPARGSPGPFGTVGVGWSAPVLADPARAPHGGYGTPGPLRAGHLPAQAGPGAGRLGPHAPLARRRGARCGRRCRAPHRGGRAPPRRPAAGRAGRWGGGRLAAALPRLARHPRLVGRRQGRAGHRPAAAPAGPARLCHVS